jgi:hypothetical protein
MSDISISDAVVLRGLKPALVSTFELLVKPITPITAPGTEAVARTVVQGYFLTIANTSQLNIKVRLQFAATTPELNLADTVVIKDVTGKNIFQELVPTADPKKFTYSLDIPAHDTILVTLLPDVTKIEILKARNVEIRGYVEISLTSPTAPTSVDLLLTPEHRGTFLPQNLAAAIPDFDQLAYALPTANGSSKFTLTGPAKPFKELKAEIKEFKEKNEFKEIENKIPDTIPDPKISETGTLENPATPAISNGAQQILGLMAQRLDQLEQRLANGQSFIQPQERPNVGEQIVNQPRN